MLHTSTPSQPGPIPLATVLDHAQAQMQATRAASPRIETADGYLYSGNRHESVPRALFLDRRLTPLERNAWQVFRLQLNADGITTFPTYAQLQPFLAAMPGTLASTETVARALTTLRLTRWLSVVRRQRDPRTGRMLGNLYVLHDEPLTPFEAMQLDAEYLGLVSQALSHASRAIQRVGQQVLQEIHDDPLLKGRLLPTRLQVLTQRLAERGRDAHRAAEASAERHPPSDAAHESEAGDARRLRNEDVPRSESEAGAKPASDGALPNPKADRTVRTDKISKERTVLRANEPTAAATLCLPPRFTALKDEQQAGAMVALRQVDAALQQAVLDEWAARCRATSVRNPAGYLFGIIQKAIRGEFKAWAGQPAAPPAPRPAAPVDPPRRATDPDVAKQHIATLRDLLRLR